MPIICNICGVTCRSIIVHLREFHKKCKDCGEAGFNPETMSRHKSKRCPVCKRFVCDIGRHVARKHPNHHECGACKQYVRDDAIHQLRDHWCPKCSMFCINKLTHDRDVHTVDPTIIPKFSTKKCAAHTGIKMSRAEFEACEECRIHPR